MRKRFGPWGSGLSAADFACALAAAGMLPPEAEPSWPADRLAAKIKDRLQRGVAWRLSAQAARFDPRVLAEAWLLLLGFRGALRIKVDPEGLSSLPRAWVEEQLSRPEVGASTRAILKGSYAVDIDINKGPSPGGAIEVDEPRMRFLQAQLSNHERIYTASIRVGVPDRQWMSVEEPFPLQENDGPEGHELTVLFWEPRVCSKPQIETLWLPPKGNSLPIRFTFEVPEGLESITARITILHANRVLQTGLLRAPVGDRSGEETFRLDALPRTRLEGLSARSRFDLALILNHDDEGTPHLTATADGQAVVLALDDGPVTQLTQLLDQQISAIAKDPDRYLGLESAGSTELLRSLAQIGGAVYDSLSRRDHLESLASAKRIHITSAKAESFLPVELLYRFRPPADTAVLCPNAAAALEAGDCPGDCPSDKRQTVCPMGFWGLSRVIERYSHQVEDQERIQGFELRAEPIRQSSPLPLSTTSLLAASSRASTEETGAVTNLLDKLQARGSAALVSTWDEWEQHVASDRPGLLVLLPHHERKDGFETLAIGEDQRLKSVLIWDEVVRKVPDGPRPIVLLMGCETNLTRISFDNPVSRFQDHGAALVVSTIATILGRHASPATALLVDLLDQYSASGDHTFGDVMLRLRQKLVLSQTPMALGLTAYGDADWVLTKGG